MCNLTPAGSTLMSFGMTSAYVQELASTFRAAVLPIVFCRLRTLDSQLSLAPPKWQGVALVIRLNKA
eukprot:6348768-Amphidinium_carterae.2